MRIIAGENRGRKLHGVKSDSTRPTMERTRETLFAILQPYLRGARFLDLFAGTGSVGLEALSRGASFAVFIDSSRGCTNAIRENLQMLERQDRSLVIGREWSPALHQLSRHGEAFDVVFADPPYPNETILPKVAQTLVTGGLLKPGGWLILQHSQRLRLPALLAPSLEAARERRFGDTTLSFYRLSETDAPPQDIHAADTLPDTRQTAESTDSGAEAKLPPAEGV